jgi:purine-nucleoside phosphorylase
MNPEGLPRFPDMTEAYDRGLLQAGRRAAKEASSPLREGVYAAMLGPSYETPAEIRMVRALGADAVGMSTVVEVIALRHRGVRVGAMSCITNMAAGMSGGLLDHKEVEQVATQSRERFVRVLSRWVELAGSGA